MQLSPQVHALRIPFVVPTAPGSGIERFVYSYVLLGERTWIIDTGVHGSAEAILALVSSLGRSTDSLEHILLTHGHVDHIGSASELARRSGAKVHAHGAERNWIENIELQAQERPVPGFFQLVGGSVALTHELVDGQVLELACDLHLRVLHVPGHSPGSCAFFLEEQGILFSGDAVPVVGDMPVYDDPLKSARSLAKLRFLRVVHILASAWDSPRYELEADRALEAGSAFLEEVHRTVLSLPVPRTESEKMDFCRAAVARLGLPETLANPMVLRSLVGHLAHREKASLVG